VDARDSTEIVEFAARCAERDTGDAESFPLESVNELKAGRLLGAALPVALGGRGWSLSECVEAVETVAAASPSVALVWAMPLGLSGIYALGPDVAPPSERARWSSQIERVAERYRAGEIFAACNSERGAGGALSAIKTVARRGPGGTFRLSGDKILASAGRYASHFFSTAKVSREEIPGAGEVEFFLVETTASGVEILDDWDGFGMRSTESQSVRYREAPAWDLMGFPDFVNLVQPTPFWSCLFAAVGLGCARGVLEEMSAPPVPASPAVRARLVEATMRYEALRAYLLATAAEWRPAAGAAYASRVLRTKTYVTQESTRLCADLMALSGGRHYRRGSRVARLLADSFAGTALRPPPPLAIETLAEQFGEPQA